MIIVVICELVMLAEMPLMMVIMDLAMRVDAGDL
jgi:hypothetical protein